MKYKFCKMKCAYVFVIWDNPKYLVGACVAAYSLRPTCHDIVLLHANLDVPDSCKALFDHTYKVDYIETPGLQMANANQQKIYNEEFVRKVCTKWRCLQLSKYKKVMYIDSDIVFQQNIDHLFALATPAGTFTSPFAKSYGGRIPDYGRLRHGQRVPADKILEMLSIGNVCAGGIVILETMNTQEFQKFLKFLKHFRMHGGYGGSDEQSISEYYAKQGVDFTNIDARYHAIPWKPNWVKDPLNAPGLHYYHDKPYEIGESNGYPDTAVFWRIFNAFEHAHPDAGTALAPYITYRPKQT